MIVAWRRELQGTDPVINLLPGCRFQIHPEVIGPKNQRYVLRPLGIGMSNHTGLTTVGTVRMHMIELLENERLQPALAQFPGSCGSHSATAKNDYVVVGHGHPSSNSNGWKLWKVGTGPPEGATQRTPFAITCWTCEL